MADAAAAVRTVAVVVSALVLAHAIGACGGGEATETVAEGSATSTDSTTAGQATEAGGAVEPDAAERGGGEEAGGGDGASGSGSPVEVPTAIPDVVEAVLTGSLPAALICDSLVTDEFVKSAYGAREGCVAAQRPGALADAVEQHSERHGGSSATVVVIPSGGPYDGVEVEVELVRDGEGWRVESLLADIPAGP